MFGQAKTECKCLGGHTNAVCSFSSFPAFALCFPRGGPGGPFGFGIFVLESAERRAGAAAEAWTGDVCASSTD